MAVSKVYILSEYSMDDRMVLSVFATREAAELARYIYESRVYRTHKDVWYDIAEKEVLDQIPISKE